MANLAPCRFLDVPVPIVASDLLRASLERVLGLDGFRLLSFDAIDQALALPAASGPVLLEAGSGRLTEVKRSLASRILAHSGGSNPPILLLLTPAGRPEDLHAIGRLSDVQIVPLPSEEARLRVSIVQTRFRIWTEEIERQITVATHLHTVLRGGLRMILRIRVDSSPGAMRPLVPGLQAIAAGVGCSPDTLSRIDRSAGRVLRPIADAWIALQILLIHELEGRTWESLAFAAGYESVSGLSQLMLRVYGRRPSKLSGNGLELGLQRIEELFWDVLAK